MKTPIQRLATRLALAALLLSTLIHPPSTLYAQGTAFTYQGRLNDSGAVASGIYDLRFTIYDLNIGGSIAGGPTTNSAILVNNGLFTVTLDFDASVFTGANRFLEIAVRTNGAGVFTILASRQQITATPYAIFANTASNLSGTVMAGQLGGTYSGAVSFTNLENSFAGNGKGLTNVNAATLDGLNSSNFWRTTGNAGTTTGMHFLGTTDNQPLEFKVNGQRVMRFEPGVNATPNVIGGASFNYVASGIVGATISGGGGTNAFGIPYSNSVAADFGTIGGGIGNAIAAPARSSTIAGGEINRIEGGQNGTISGGADNTLDSNGYGAIAGGTLNRIENDANYSKIGGGYSNTIESNADYSSVGGGWKNAATRNGTTIGGGLQNTASGYGATVAGGGDAFNQGNTAAGDWSNISGGKSNTTTGEASAIGGGEGNSIEIGSANSVISGGSDNAIQTDAGAATISGGFNNQITSNVLFAAIGGGDLNFIDSYAGAATISGGGANAIGLDSFGATIGGGGYNKIRAESGMTVIAGGYENVIETNCYTSVIGGGLQNFVRGGARQSVISGGVFNNIDSASEYSVIAGGKANFIALNVASGSIGGGEDNQIQQGGTYATIPGGRLNSATNYAFAAGNRAKANHTGAFVWGDSTSSDITSTNNDSVTMRAGGGYRLFSNTNATLGVFLTASGSSWSSISDRDAKKNFQAVDARVVMEKLAQLPLQYWNYKSEADDSVPHLGPMAQDFKAAFYSGRDDKSISTLEFDGVELAAIQGLNQKLEETRVENAELKARLEKLEHLMNQINRGAK